MSIEFTSTPITNFEGNCSICLFNNSESRGDCFINHTNSTHNPLHLSCIKKWLEDNSTCPVCRVDIQNKLTSPLEVVTNIGWQISGAASAGANTVSGTKIFGAFAVATCAAILFGEWATRDTLALAGGGYGLAYLTGIFARFMGNGAGAQARIESMAPLAAATGVLTSLIPLWTRATQQAHLLQGLAVYGFVRSAGFIRTGVSATIGLAATGASQILLQPDAWEKTLTVLSGGAGTFINRIRLNWKLNALSILAGMKVSYWTYEDYGPFAAAILGCVTSGVAKTILSRAYGKQPGG